MAEKRRLKPVLAVWAYDIGDTCTLDLEDEILT